jgi:hypothetical protein
VPAGEDSLGPVERGGPARNVARQHHDIAVIRARRKRRMAVGKLEVQIGKKLNLQGGTYSARAARDEAVTMSGL